MTDARGLDPLVPLRHVAIIMDGNNRWARERQLGGISGHRHGVENVRKVLSACRRHNIQILTLFAFSSENWQRPPAEVRGLMSLFATYIRSESRKLKDEGVSLTVIGERKRFSPGLCRRIERAEKLTEGGDTNLVLAVDYGGRWDITRGARRLAQQVEQGNVRPQDITEDMFERELCLAQFSPPDLCIRTAGEQRISNFLLWQLAYTELHFAPCYWPDFGEQAFDEAVAEYYRRQRRFGLSSSQLNLPNKESA